MKKKILIESFEKNLELTNQTSNEDILNKLNLEKNKSNKDYILRIKHKMGL